MNMKKTILLTLTVCFATIGIASAQILPTFSFGAKAGVTMATFPANGRYENNAKPGYLGGAWARFGGLGFNFQPEVYVTSKNIDIKDAQGQPTNKAKFTSIDVPLLVGGKIGAFGLGGRFYGGPVFSYTINDSQTASKSVNDITHLQYKDANYGLQVGAGLDIKDFSIDLRYEAGLNKIAYEQDSHTRVSVFSLSLAYKIFSL
jgi:hypothetical protein